MAKAKAKKKPNGKLKRKHKRCIVPRCTRQRITRGACWKCYRYLMLKVSEGRVTEKKLIEKGLLLEKAKSGPKGKSPAMTALEKMKVGV